MTHIDLDELRAIAGTSPHMRIGALLHMLEKRKKVEELREELVTEVTKVELQSFYQWLLNRGK
jgi:hypothetical protein